MRIFISMKNSRIILYLYTPTITEPKYERIRGERKQSPVAVVVSHSLTISGRLGGSQKQGLYAVFPTDVIVMCSTGSEVSVATEHLNCQEDLLRSTMC